MDTRALILGTAGHIDHGKTALVRALTGTDTDRLPEEKARGITIDIGFAHLDLDTAEGVVRMGIVDVPGHERFIRNMLAGAAGVDLALLVVAADDSVMPQTREHLAILGFLGVRTGVIAITKCDRADPDWLALVEDDVRTLVAGTSLAGAEIVRTSASVGTGLDELRAALARAVAAHPHEETARPFRMAIDRSFVKEGLGTVVTGTIGSGGVAVGEVLAWHAQRPGPAQTVSVRGIQSHGVVVERAEAGSRAALVLGGVHHEEVARGHELATPGYLEASSWLTVRLRVVPESPWPVRHRARVRLHLGTAEVPARIALLEGTQVEPGREAVAQLVTARPVTAVSGQPFVLRAESPLMTLGGGRVLEPTARRRTRRDAGGRAAVGALAGAGPEARVLAAVERRGARDYATLDLAREAGVAPSVAEKLATGLVADGAIVELAVPPQRVVRLARTTLEDLAGRVRRAVTAAHEAAPLEVRVARSAVKQRLGSCDERVVEGVIDRLIGERVLVGDERDVADVRFKPKLTERQRALAAALAEAFEGSAFGPPDAARIARESGAGERDLKPAIEICVSRGELVHIGGGQFLHRRWESELRTRTRAALAGGDGLTMSELKELLETTRKFAVPIGEYLDRIGLTRRVGDRRVLRQAQS